MREDAHDALTAGVKPGGLNSKHTIRVLLCYIIDSVKEPITQNQLEEAIVETELVNLFEFADALSRLEKQNLVTLNDGAYTITEDGHFVAQQLERDVPFTAKEQAYNVAIKCLQYSKISKHTSVDITNSEHGYNVTFSLKDEYSEIFSASLFIPDKGMAEHVKEKVFHNSTAVYQCMLAALSGDVSMYSAAVEALKKM